MLIEDLPTNIIKDCLKNSQGTWEILFKATFPFAKWIAGSPPFLLDSSTSEDIAQEVIIALCKQLKEVKNIRAFISKVTHNKCVDYLRKKNPGQPNNREGQLELITISCDYKIEQSIFNIIRMHISSMNTPCCDLIRERFFNEKSYKNISESLGLSVSKVGVYLQRCLIKLKDNLSNDDPDLFKELEEILKT